MLNSTHILFKLSHRVLGFSNQLLVKTAEDLNLSVLNCSNALVSKFGFEALQCLAFLNWVTEYLVLVILWIEEQQMLYICQYSIQATSYYLELMWHSSVLDITQLSHGILEFSTPFNSGISARFTLVGT